MTRINTNVSSLIGRNNLNRANTDLSQSLTRLSTGLRINTGKDDPAGLIASENLRSDITAIKRAISNTDRANQVIATADSALGQVSSLLNDIRGLVTESANAGALSDEQIAANQLQIDSSLEALNRISQTTTFQGRRLLDGSLDFITSAGTNFANLSSLQIDQANLGASGEVSIDVAVTAAATKAQVNVGGITPGVAASASTGSITFGDQVIDASGSVTFDIQTAAAQGGTGTGNLELETVDTTQAVATASLGTEASGTLTINTEASATLTLSSEAEGTVTLAGETFDLVALNGGDAAGAEGNEVANIDITFDAAGASTSYDSATNTLNVSVTQSGGTADIDDIIAAINTGTDFAATIGGATGGTTVDESHDDAATLSLTGGDQALTLRALDTGAAADAEGNNLAAVVINYNTGGDTSSYAGGTLTINVNATAANATVADIKAAIDAGSDFQVVAGSENDAATIADGSGSTATASGGIDTINLTALSGGAAAGVAGDSSSGLSLNVVYSQVGASSSFAGNTLTVNVTQADGEATLQNIIDAINSGSDFSADIGSANANATLADADDPTANFVLTGGGADITLTAVQDGAADGAAGNTAANIDFVFDASAAGTSYDEGTGTLTVSLTQSVGVATTQNVIDAINAGSDFTASLDAGFENTGVINADDDPSNGAITVNSTGADATTSAETFGFTSVAGAGNDFNITFQTDLTANITNVGTLATFGVSGNATSGYVVTVASDATTNLTTLASELSGQITELESVAYSGSASDVFDPSNGADALPTSVSVTGSTDATTVSDSITIAGATGTGASGNVAISFQTGTVVGGGSTAITGDADSGYVVTIDDSSSVTLATIASDLSAGIAEITASYSGSSSLDPAVDNVGLANTELTNGRDAGSDVITITATESSEDFDGTITFNTTNSVTGGIDVSVTDGDITVSVDASSSYSIADIAAAIGDLEGYTASVTTAEGTGTFDADDADDNQTPTTISLAGGQAASGGLSADAVIELSGSSGAEVFNLRQGTTLSELVEQINLVSDATGVSAEAGAGGTTLLLTSTGYGSDAVVDLQVIEEDASGTFTTAVDAGQRDTGSDIVATVNGVAAKGDGNKLSVNTATIDLSADIEAEFTGTIEFDITGGGALFQLGPDVVSNQQARLGISSVNTSSLGGASGLLYELGSGGNADLSSDPTTAALIVEEAIDQVTSLRGRLGAFQRTTLETNKNALNDTLSNLTEAESTIRDADFAVETANLTRSQILVQSGTRVLAIANQNPQNVLGLLG